MRKREEERNRGRECEEKRERGEEGKRGRMGMFSQHFLFTTYYMGPIY